MDNKYWVVEIRLPVQNSPQDAAMKAARQIENKYGISVSNWFLRVFEYGGEPDRDGVVAEYFSNPSGSVFREVTANITKHEELIKDNEQTPEHSS